MSGSNKEVYGSSAGQEDITKKGLCFLELRRAGMVQWGELGQVSSADQHEDPKLSSFTVKEEQNNDVLSPQNRKRPPKLLQLKESKSTRHLKQKQTTTFKQIKQEKLSSGQKENSVSNKKAFIDRWSVERYKLAEKSMFEVMKAEGAVYENPITRSALRVAARKYIPDTGLLDHLLKHINGKVVPGGTERFRRCYNTEGAMEYWLESANIVRVKPENGVPNSNWVPQSCWIPGSAAIQHPVSNGELELLKEEIAKLKREMGELTMKNKEQYQVNLVQEMLKELMTWRVGTDQRLIEISNSLTGMQNMYKDLITWKSHAEKKLMEISNSVNSTQAPKQCSTSLSPVSESWEDWLENNMDNIQGENLVPWIGNTDLVSVRQDGLLQECSASQPWSKQSLFQDPNCGRDLELLKKEIGQTNRNMQYLVPEKGEDAQASVSADSSVTKFDLENPFILYQEMVHKLMKWKPEMEERMLALSNAVNLLASRQYTV